MEGGGHEVPHRIFTTTQRFADFIKCFSVCLEFKIWNQSITCLKRLGYVDAAKEASAEFEAMKRLQNIVCSQVVDILIK